MQEEGHPDLRPYLMRKLGISADAADAEIWGFAGEISSIPALVCILVTIAWTASAHHAAVNFGQVRPSAAHA